MKVKVKIAESCKIHKDVTIVDPVNLYGCEIHQNALIGPFVEVQKDVIFFCSKSKGFFLKKATNKIVFFLKT